MTIGKDKRRHFITCRLCNKTIKRDGRNQKQCTKCSIIYGKQYQKKYSKKYRKENKEALNLQSKLHKRQVRAKYPLREKRKQQAYYQKNRERITTRMAKRRKENSNGRT